MKLRFRQKTHKGNSGLSAIDLQAPTQLMTVRRSHRKASFVARPSLLATAFVIAMFISASAIAQEQQRAYSEFTYWFGGAFENRHAFSSTIAARSYRFDSRYDRPIYSGQPFAVRWVFDVVPVALVGDRYTSRGRRVYSYGDGGSPIGAQVNFVHYRHIEPFLTSAGGFLYFNHRMFGTTQQFNFTAQLGGGVQLFTSNRRTAVDLGYKYFERESGKSPSWIGPAYVVRRVVLVSMSDAKDETSTNTAYTWLNSTSWVGPIVVKTGGSHISASEDREV